MSCRRHRFLALARWPLWAGILLLVACSGRTPPEPRSTETPPPATDPNRRVIMDEEVTVEPFRPSLREMSEEEATHWLTYLRTTREMLEFKIARNRVKEEELFDLMHRLNEMAQMALSAYTRLPEAVETEFRLLLSLINRTIVQLREPQYAQVVEVPVYEDEPAPPPDVEPETNVRKKPPRRIRFYSSNRTFSFIWPLSRYEVTSRYGMRTDPIRGQTQFHDGIDLAAPRGSLVYASERGRVLFTGWSGGSGRLVILEHQDGFETFYAHLDDILTVRGMIVERGQAIGRVGSTGRSTGYHLHFKISHKGSSMNPESVVGKDLGPVGGP